MIELIPGLPDDVLGIEAKGEVTGEDYERVLVPAVERQRELHEKVRLLYVLGDDFGGYAPLALWDDAKLGMHHPFAWERIAVVTDHRAYADLVKGFGFLVPGKVRVFGVGELETARAWVAERG